MTKGHLSSAVAIAGLVAVGCGILTGPDGNGSLSIARFTASPTAIDSGAKAMLLWSVDGAETVSIDQGIGDVETSGSMQVTPRATTTYTLSAAGGTSSATATVVVVVGGSSPSPDPAPSPTPSANPSPSPSPSTSPSPLPSSTPPPTGDRSCGKPQATLDGCRLTVEWPSEGTNPGECAQLTRITAIPSCPVSLGMTRTITFDVFAQSGQALSWRRAAGGSDSVFPASGPLGNGLSTVTTTAVVYDSAVTFEVVNLRGSVLLRFTMGHR